jgi:hypothetical protein
MFRISDLVLIDCCATNATTSGLCVFTPKALHIKAQGRAAHPGLHADNRASYPKGVSSGMLPAVMKPLRGIKTRCGAATQGGASLALGFDMQRLRRKDIADDGDTY